MADMPAWGSGTTAGSGGSVQSQLNTSVGNLAPMATQWNGTAQNTFAQYIAPSTAPQYNKAAGPSWIQGFEQKVSSLGSESAHLTGDAGKWLLNMGKTAVEAPVRFTIDSAKFDLDTIRAFANSSEANAQQSALQKLNLDFKQGRITHTQYSEGLKQWTKDQQRLTQSTKDQVTSANYLAKNYMRDTINTASDVLTIMTGGGLEVADIGIQAASDFLKSDAANALMQPAEQAIARIAVDKAAMNVLSDGASNGVKDSIYNVLFAGAKSSTDAGLARAAAANLLLKYPLTFNALSGTGQQAYKQLQQDKYGNALGTIGFNAAVLLTGGVFGTAAKGAGKILSLASDATFGKTTFLDVFAQAMGHNVQDYIDAINQGGKDVAQGWTNMEATNINAMRGDVTSAVYRIVDAWKSSGNLKEDMTPQQIVTDAHNWSVAQSTVRDDLIAHGMSEANASRVVVGRWTALDKNAAADVISKGSSRADRLQAWEDYKTANPNSSFSNNKSLDNEVKQAINASRSGKDAATRIKGIEAQFRVPGLSKSVGTKLAKMGYVPIEPSNLEAPFIEGSGKVGSKAVQDGSQFFTRATSPVPVLGHLGTVLTNAGLSPIVATQRVQDLFTNSFSKVLSERSILGTRSNEDGDLILKKLGNYMNTKFTQIAGRRVQSISDYRQLSIKDIGKALNVGTEDAKEVRSAITDAMIKVPIQVRGLGDHVMDLNYKFNPAAKYFARLQSATRFAWNPIFQARVSYKYEILAQAQAEGKPLTLLGTHTILSHIFSEYYNRLPAIDKILEDGGVYGHGLAAEASGGEGNLLYRSTAHTLLDSQRRTISSLVATMADRAEMPVKDFIKAFPEQTRDAVRTITEYNPKANFLNSPLTRTINYAFFPFRFNVKVATAVAQLMVKQPAIVQFALLKGMMQAHTFLNSAEGQAWYSKNSDVIKVAEYFTPLETLSTVMQAVDRPLDVQSYGELGGLPFGFISGLLQAEGILNQQPYVSPSTGQVVPNYVPTDTKGRFASAIEDFLGVLYTYPGATVGLTSKSKVDSTVADWFIPGHSKTDFKTKTPTNLTPQQQSFSQVVQNIQQHKQTVQSPLSQPQQTPQFNINTPAQSPPSSFSPGNKGPASTTAKKLKKGQYIPYLLPGQTKLGQIP